MFSGNYTLRVDCTPLLYKLVYNLTKEVQNHLFSSFLRISRTPSLFDKIGLLNNTSFILLLCWKNLDPTKINSKASHQQYTVYTHSSSVFLKGLKCVTDIRVILFAIHSKTNNNNKSKMVKRLSKINSLNLFSKH